MLNHRTVVKALRARLLTVVVVTTGDTALASTGNGYTRAAGSFITDGFTRGMEVVPAGFANNDPAVIKTVSDLEITTFQDGRPIEAAAAGRSLTVGIPEIRGWENVEMKPIDSRWYIEEDYLPGPSRYISAVRRGLVMHQPTYVLRVSGLAGLSISALYDVSGSILEVFPPLLALELPDGNHIRVRGDQAPYKGQVYPGEAGRAGIVITIPLWAQTINPI